MKLDYHVLDVFTDQRFGGNPLAVVLGADALDTATMQTVAREFNLSETVFVMKPENPAHSARIRIFTPRVELPFAGHPTVGTAVVLAQKRDAGPQSNALLVLEQQIGIVRVGVRLKQDGTAPYAELDAPRRPEEGVGLPAIDRMAAALGLIPSEIGFENHRPTRFSAGNTFAFVPVASMTAITKAAVNSSHWSAAFANQNLLGVFLYTRQVTHTTSSFHARMFAPDSGIMEDPATGSAAVAFAGVLQKFDDLKDGSHRRIIEQGFEMGRPSLITLGLEVSGGKLATVRIGGQAVRVAEGKVDVSAGA